VLRKKARRVDDNVDLLLQAPSEDFHHLFPGCYFLACRRSHCIQGIICECQCSCEVCRVEGEVEPAATLSGEKSLSLAALGFGEASDLM
jgi:hypothetical protein